MEIAVKAHKQKRKCTTEAERDARMRARLDSMGTSVKSTGGSRQSQGREVDARLARVQRPTSTSHSGGRDEQRSRPKAKNSKASTDTTEMQARMQARLDSMGTSVKTAGGSRQKETDKPAAQSSKASASSVRNRGSPQSGQQLQHTKALPRTTVPRRLLRWRKIPFPQRRRAKASPQPWRSHNGLRLEQV